MNFHLNTAFIVSCIFGYVVWSFSLNFRKSLISSLTHSWFGWVLFYFHLFVCFLKSALLLNSNFKPQWSNKIQGVILIFLYLLRFALLLNIWSIFFIRFHEVLRRRSILFCLDGMFYIFLLSPFVCDNIY